MPTIAIQPHTEATPLESLMAHFSSSSKKVQRAFTKCIIDAYAEEVEIRRQQKMMKESLTQAFKEHKEGQACPVEEFFSKL